MTATPTCPRCRGPLHAPGLMTSTWDCPEHGAVAPYVVVPHPGPGAMRTHGARSAVPLWFPLPLLPGWTLGGLGIAGDERGAARASAVALSGPSPLGGPADLVLVAEEPGVGLGARVAGLAGLDPGEAAAGPPDAKLLAAGHPTPMWRTGSAQDRVAFAGEALGVWLWAVLWPPAAELVLLEHVELHDLRHEAHLEQELPLGAPTARL